MNWLITGGCGFIGVNLVGFLLKKYPGIKIRILDNLSVGKRENLAKVCDFVEINSSLLTSNSSLNSVELIIGDIRDRDMCMEACKEVDAVVHLAAHAGVIPSIEDPFFDFEVNALGTLNLLDASIKNGVENFIFASSNAPIGSQTPPLREEKVPKPLSPYGASKLACEGYCSAFHGSYGLKTVVLRFSNVYGPYSIHKNSVIAKFIKDGLLKRRLTIYGDGQQTRDFIHVEDLCSAIHLLLTPHSSLPQSIWGETFNLGTGKETSIIELTNYIRELFGGNIKIVFEPERKGEIKRNYSDISKAKAVLGFEPKIDLNEGVKGVHEWFRSQGIERLRESTILSGSE